jgi:hypothetical protein
MVKEELKLEEILQLMKKYDVYEFDAFDLKIKMNSAPYVPRSIDDAVRMIESDEDEDEVRKRLAESKRANDEDLYGAT